MAELTLDVSNMAEFDALAQSVAAKLNCALSLVSVLQDDALLALGHSSADEPFSERSVLARDTICVHTMQAGAALRVPDVHADRRFRDAPTVRTMNIGAYMGVPLRSDDGTPMGAMCALSASPRIWSNAELAYLEAIADLVESKIERLVLRYEQKALSDALAENDAILTTLAEASGTAITIHNDAGELVFANDATRADLELTYQELLVLPHAAQRLASGGARSGDVSVDMPGRPSHALHVQLYAPKAGLTLAEWSRTDPA
ncbi:GAF domain-containing protein [uncultured Tateyamaria sp.]|uniref:GAF domain-containing protein n=1 Tax=uncultured Tateyamaria sp. TaxID=455651 RepID=UPI002636A667|nr:GAF domain-containing protein [uncultured Tateyamaria sp.]